MFLYYTQRQQSTILNTKQVNSIMTIQLLHDRNLQPAMPNPKWRSRVFVAMMILTSTVGKH